MIGTPIDVGFKSTTGRPTEEAYLNNGVAWVDQAAVLAGIDAGMRYDGMKVRIGLVDYEFKADLVTLEAVAYANDQTASEVPIVDSAAMYDATNVEDALAEVMAYAESIDTALSALSFPLPPYSINLPAAANLAAKIAAATEGVDYPTGWVLAATDTYNLTITHGLAKEIDHVTVKKVVGAAKTILKPYSTAYSEVTATTTSILVIEGVDPTATQTLIHLTFLP